MVINQQSQSVTPPLISLRGITKHFGDVKANQLIDLDIHASEVHALLGENGAGKSTLVKILYGFYRADAGAIFYQDEPVSIQSPHDARALQIGMVFQNPEEQMVGRTFELEVAFGPENLALSSEEILQRVMVALETVEIEPLAKRLVTGLSTGWVPNPQETHGVV